MAEKRSGGDRNRRQSNDRQRSRGKPSGSGPSRPGRSSRDQRAGQEGGQGAKRGQGRSTGRGDTGSRQGTGRGSSSGAKPYKNRSSGDGDYREREHKGRHGRDSQARSGQRRAFSVDGGPSNLPKWLREEIQRVTPADRQDATLTLLSEAASDFADEQFGSAHRKLLKAKNLSSRASAIRELLGLTAYRLGKYDESLRELRAFRRFTGDTTHMPVEIDSLRGLRRHDDIDKTFELFMELGGNPATDAEARVVYGSFLLDQQRNRDAWDITRPRRVTKESKAYERRRWFVAANAALALGDVETATKLATAVRDGDADLPGLDELTERISAAS